MMRAAAAQRSPRSATTAASTASATSATSNNNNSQAEQATPNGPSRGRISLQTGNGSGLNPPKIVNPTPLTSTGSTTSSTASSSGYSSITGAETPHSNLGSRGSNPGGGRDYACSSASPNSSTTSTVPVPSVSSSSTESSKSGTCRIIPIIKVCLDPCNGVTVFLIYFLG